MEKEFFDAPETPADDSSTGNTGTQSEGVGESSQQCFEKCPENATVSGHRGACYLDVGHSSKHKCSVDGHEWD